MAMINEIGRNVMQGGSRRSAIYASLNWKHGDAGEFLHCKDWSAILVAGAFDESGKQLTIADLKEKDFNFPAPLDMTNISLNYDNQFLEELYGMSFGELMEIYMEGGKKAIFDLEIAKIPFTFLENCRQALKTGEPGFSFNFFEKVLETLRNACTEVTSADDSDVCNLASVNMSRIETIKRFERVCYLVGKFLLCGTMVAQLPYELVYKVREKNRRLGMGIMGVHEWLLQRGYKYEVTPELHKWLAVYKKDSESGANELADILSINRPIAFRAIAPTGTIGILAGTTTGIEPLFAVAYKRRYLKGQKEWHYQYVIDGTAKLLIEKYGIDPYKIETALSLANDYERRIKFQADVQDYVDMSISSTINLPKWGTLLNNDSKVDDFAHVLAKYAVRLRGFTCYPDGSRGGQPLTIVDYNEALSQEGQEFKEEFFDVCELNKGGVCGA
jgi:ribonucleoside-diphosphate reductase alpha chain